MITLLALSPAFALVCDPADDVCNATNTMTASANAAFGMDVVDDAASTRLQPATFASRLGAIVNALEANGCTADGLQNHLSGAYDSGTGSTTGSWDGGTLSGAGVGAGKTFFGTMDGLTSYGSSFSSYNRQGQIVADRDDGGYVAGVFSRVQGRRGVFMAVTGTCEGDATAAEALATWYRGDLAPWDGGEYVFMDAPDEDWMMLDRIGMPAVNTAVITSKDLYNVSTPADDVAGVFVPEIVANIDFLHGALDDDLIGVGLTPCATPDCVGQGAPLIVPDTMSIDPSAPAGFPNGRMLPDPVVDVTLGVILLDLNVHPVDLLATLPLNPPANDRAFRTGFPYLASPN